MNNTFNNKVRNKFKNNTKNNTINRIRNRSRSKYRTKINIKKFHGGAMSNPNNKTTNEIVYDWNLPIISQIKFNTPIDKKQEINDFIAENFKYYSDKKKSHYINSFKHMLKRENMYSNGEYAVFYHSYAYPHILFDLQTAIVELLYGLEPDINRVIPRLIGIPFKTVTIDNIKKDLSMSNKKNNHDIGIRKVLISATCSLFANNEIDNFNVFETGYSCADVNYMSILENLIITCFMGIDEESKKKLIEKILNDMVTSEMKSGYTSRPRFSCHRHGYDGRLLQIFVKKSELKHFVYKSLVFGKPNNTVGECSGEKGQVRILGLPEYFINSDIVKTYLYHADIKGMKQREKYIAYLKTIISEYVKKNTEHIKEIIGVVNVSRNSSV